MGLTPETQNALSESSPTRGGVPAVLAWAALLGLLALNLPPFLCMALDSDVTLWDLGAWNVLHGGVFYRDTAENNLPGMLWLHLAVRSAFGWRSGDHRAMVVL